MSTNGSERNLQEMKRKILSQIDKTISESPLRVRDNRIANDNRLTHDSRLQASHSSSLLQDTTTGQRRYPTSASRSDIATGEETDFALSRNLRTLKQQILEKERAQDEANGKIKVRSSVIKDEVEHMHSRLGAMQDTLKSRDRAIFSLESQLNQSRTLAIQQTRETVLEKTQEDMHNTILNLRNKLAQRKAQLQDARQEVAMLDQEFAEEKRRNMEDRLNTEAALSQFKERFEREQVKAIELERILDQTRNDKQSRDNYTERVNSQQAEQQLFELSTRLEREEDLTRELRQQLQLQEKKQIEQEKQLHLQDDKSHRNRKKFEEEKAILLSERKKESEKRKTKNAKLKAQLKLLNERINELTGNNVELASEKDKYNRNIISLQQELALKNTEVKSLKDQITVLREDIDTLKHSHRDSEVLLKREQQEHKKQEREASRLTADLQQQNEKIASYEEELHFSRKRINEVESELQLSLETSQSQADLLVKIERQNQFLSEMQNRDIEKLEEKVIAINSEASELRKDNEDLRFDAASLKHELDQVSRESRTTSVKINKYKNQVSLLQQALAEADEKLREIIHFKHNQIRAAQQGSRYDDEEEAEGDYYVRGRSAGRQSTIFYMLGR